VIPSLRTPAGTRHTGILTNRRLLLGAIVLLAVLCRVVGLGDRLSADEGYSWLVASAPDPGAFFDRLAMYENTPPLFYALIAPLPLDDEAWIRLPAVVAGVAAVPVLYAIVRPLVGTRAALLAALGLAVAPLHVGFSNYARGFMLAGLGSLLALWAVARLAQGAPRRWWWLYALGAALAVYSEYYAALFLLPLLGALLALRARPWREVLALGLAPMLLLAAWLPELSRSLDFEGETKIAPRFPGASPATVRDVVVSLFFGEDGATAAVGLRLLLFAGLVAALAVTVVLLRRRAAREPGARILLWLAGATAAGALVLHAASPLADLGVFQERYLTGLIPLGAALLAAGVDSLPWRPAVPLAAVALLGVGAAVVVQRYDRETEPDYGRVERIIRRAEVRTVLTNSAVAAYYLRDLDTTLDRPFNLGRGREARTEQPYAVVDEAWRARPGPGERTDVGGIEVRIVR
jgi:4-amino-4-deoxy-L-arabinose transferase-like glycosyltransferase